MKKRISYIWGGFVIGSLICICGVACGAHEMLAARAIIVGFALASILTLTEIIDAAQ